MNMVIYFDGKEAVIENPNSALEHAVEGVLYGTSRRTTLTVEAGVNCHSILVRQSTFVGMTLKLMVRTSSITAARYAVPTSQESGKSRTRAGKQGSES
jgi:hypothetical protein